MRVGETGCHRTVSPFSRSRIRHCSGSRSCGRSASAPPRRQAVSVCRRSSSVSSSGSSPVRRRRVVDLGQALVGDSPAGGGQAARLVHLPGRVLIAGDEPVFLGVLVHAAQGGDEVLGGAAPAAGVPPGHDVGPDVLDELADLRRRAARRCRRLPHCSVTRFQYEPYAFRQPSLTRADTTGMYSAKVGAGGLAAGAASRSAGVRPIRSSTSMAASTTACPGAA